jgi:hypothetical protein
MEFRAPSLTKPDGKPPERFAKAFNFDPGKREVADRTNLMVQSAAQARIQQKAAQQSAPTGGPGAPKP